MSAANRQKLNIGFLAWESQQKACPYVRLKAPLTMLHRKNAVNYVELGDLEQGPMALERLKILDILIVQRKMAALLSYDDLLKLLPTPRPKIVYEIDDALTIIPETNPHYEEYEEIKPAVIEYLTRADRVTVSTQPLKEMYRRYNDNIDVLPNYIDPHQWKKPESEPLRQKEQTLLLSGTFTHAADLAQLEEALLTILDENKGRLKLIQWGVAGRKLERHPQVKTISLIPDYRRYAEELKKIPADLAVVPLEQGDYNRAKSNIKWQEYSVCRIPGIYTGIYPYAETVRHGETGILVRNSRDRWYDTIKTRLANPGELRKIADNAYREVQNRYNLEDHVKQWQDVYERLQAGKNRPARKRYPEEPAAIEGEAWYRKVLTLNKVSPDYLSTAYIRLGEIERRKGNPHWKSSYIRALQHLEKKKKQAAADRYRIASIYKCIGEPDEAQIRFRQLLENEPAQSLAAGAHYHSGDIQAAKGNHQEALKHLRRCLQINPEHRNAAVLLEKLELQNDRNKETGNKS